MAVVAGRDEEDGGRSLPAIEAVLEALPAALLVTDDAGVIVYATKVAHALYRYPVGTLVGRRAAVLVDEVDRARADEILGGMGSGRSWTGEFSIRRGDGTLIRLMCTNTPVVEAGRVVGIVGVAQPLDTEKAEAALVGRLVALAGIVGDLTAAGDLSALYTIVTVRAADILGAEMAAVFRLDEPGWLRLVARRRQDGDVERWERIPVDGNNPVSEAFRTGEAVTVPNYAESERRYPGMWPSDRHDHAVVAVPLLVGGHGVGAVCMAFPVQPAVTEVDVRFLRSLADSAAQAMDRIRATRAAADAARKLRFLAEASQALAASLDYEATLRTVAQLAVPDLADWCSIDLFEDGSFRRVAISHMDPAMVELANRLSEMYPPDMQSEVGAPAVVRTGRSELIEEISAELLSERGVDEERVRIVRDLSLSSAVTVALTARGRKLGVLTLVYAESGRHYRKEDVAFAEDLGRRAAVAIENAHLHTETLQVALQLQQAVLPDSFTPTPNWDVAVHYRPAGRTDVGGDFYDAICLPDGRLAALIGDVMGRGVAAAATMAQTRSALRAYLAVDPDPAAVLGRLDVMFAQLEMQQLVTVVYALIDPAGRSARIATAGHLPPILVSGGRAVLRHLPASPPLGLALGDRKAEPISFGDGDLMLLYTDGVVERRGEDLDEGLTRLVQAAPGLVEDVSDAALAGLADRMRAAGHDDDVTLLAVRLRTPD